MDILELEQKSTDAKEELQNFENLRNELSQKINEERESYEKINEQHSKLIELVPLLEKRKKEIEQSNADLENRFAEMFQRFNRELNEINKKRNVLEQIIIKKEKDLEERDQMLFEKIAALEESERVLNARQTEIESFENVIKNLGEQKGELQNQLMKIDEETMYRKNYNNDLKIETELMVKKRISLEKGLQELLSLMSDNIVKSEAKKFKLEDDLKSYDEKLQSYQDKIKESMRELGNIQASIGSIKLEQEEQKGNISRLNTMKKKLQEDILKQQTTLQKFQKIREKLKIEQAIAKNKKVGGPYMGESDASKPPNGPSNGVKNTQIFKL